MRANWAGVGVAIALALLVSQQHARAGVVYGAASMKLLSSPNYHGPFGTSGVTVKLFGDDDSLITSVALSSGGSFQWTDFSFAPMGGTGGEYFDFLGNPLAPLDSKGMMTFCIELTQTISPGTKYKNLNVIPLEDAPQSGTPGLIPMGPSAANLIGELWYRYFDSILAATTRSQQSQYAGAFQLAIWELEYDGGVGPDLTAGHLRATRNLNVLSIDTLRTAQDWLNSLTGTHPRAKLVAFSADGFQDQLTQITAPEPASIAIWTLVATLGLIPRSSRWRRRRPSVLESSPSAADS